MTSKLSVNTQRSNSFSSDNVEISNENSLDAPTSLETRSNSEPFNSARVVVTSPTFGSDLSSEQNDSIEQLNSSSSSHLQTKQHQTKHRRNKSEPFKSASNEDLSSSLTTTSDTKDENRRKSATKFKQSTSEKTPPSSTTTTRKKKAWYNVSNHFLYPHLFNASMSQSIYALSTLLFFFFKYTKLFHG